MQSNKVILVAGGDLRQKYAAQKLAQLPDWTVKTVGLSQKSGEGDSVGYDVLVLPVPASVDGKTVPTPPGNETLTLESLAALGNPGALVLGGKCTPAVQSCFSAAGMTVEDYFHREELCLSNAVPTAEGAIQIAMEETAFALHGASALVIGYGRIGMALASRLSGLGMQVTVCARRCETRALAALHGCCAVPMSRLEEQLAQSQVVFQTVPAQLLTEAALRRLPADALVIDLASRPGGTDFSAAKQLGVRVVWALSLPPKRRR